VFNLQSRGIEGSQGAWRDRRQAIKTSLAKQFHENLEILGVNYPPKMPGLYNAWNFSDVSFHFFKKSSMHIWHAQKVRKFRLN
jgi:hypothetical protein